MTGSLPALLFLLPFLAALLCPIVNRLSRQLVWWLTILTLLATAGVVVMAAGVVIASGPINYHMGGWEPPYGIAWRLDHGSLLGCALIIGLALITLAGGRRTVEIEAGEQSGFFYACCLLLLSGLLGMVLTADLFNLFVHLEVGALSAYGLVSVGGRGSTRAALRYLIIGSLGATAYLLGVGFLFAATGTLNMMDLTARLAGADPQLITIGMVFITVGLGVKMGLFPLHGWMPEAYSRTSAVSGALMAPMVTKISAFVLLRILVEVLRAGDMVSGAVLLPILSATGAVAMIGAGLLAIGQRNLRRLLVFSSISQVGLIAIGIGVANRQALTGAVLHVVNDGLMKGVLFTAAGMLLVHYRIRDVDELPRLRGRAPWTSAAIAVAGLSLVGIPPLCGFFGKWYVLVGSIRAGRWDLAAAILIGSVITGIYIFRIFEKLFFSPVPEDVSHHAGSRGMALAGIVLAVGIIIFGLMTGTVVDLLIAPMLAATGGG